MTSTIVPRPRRLGPEARPGRILAALLLAGGLVSCAQTPPDRPHLVDPRREGAAARPCSERYRPLEPVSVSRSGDVEEALEAAFSAEKTWGLGENVQIVADSVARSTTLEVRYPAGSRAPSARAPLGGAGFYSRMGLPARLERVCLHYEVRFEEDFDFVRGGKLPGLFGGPPDRTPSGGADPEPGDGFTLRLMWREEGAGELYGYFHNMDETSERGGMSLGRGRWHFQPGVWHRVEVEVVLNAPGRKDGIARIWIDGRPRLAAHGLELRRSNATFVSGLMFSTFFGGQSMAFAPRTRQHIRFHGFQMFEPAGPPTTSSRSSQNPSGSARHG